MTPAPNSSTTCPVAPEEARRAVDYLRDILAAGGLSPSRERLMRSELRQLEEQAL